MSQPRVAAIEQSRNVTIDVLDQYVHALGGSLELTVVQGQRRIDLLGAATGKKATTKDETRQGHARTA